jgi:hypothetical protein
VCRQEFEHRVIELLETIASELKKEPPKAVSIGVEFQQRGKENAVDSTIEHSE